MKPWLRQHFQIQLDGVKLFEVGFRLGALDALIESEKVSDDLELFVAVVDADERLSQALKRLPLRLFLFALDFLLNGLNIGVTE